MAKWKKWLIAVFLVGAIGTLAVLLLLVDSLPGPKELAQAVDAPPTKTPHETHDIGVADKAAVKAEDKTDATDTKSQENNKDVILAFMDEDPADIRVCDNLTQSKMFEQQKNKKEMSFDDLFKDTSRTDPIAEALRIPIKAIFQDESVTSLLRDVMKVDTSKMNKEEKDSLLDKLGFYSRAATTAASLLSRKKHFEALGDRAIHMSLLARIAILKPEKFESLNLQGICEDMERSIVNGEKTSVKQERKKILALIKDAGLTPADLKFDPEQFLNFDVKMTDNNVSFSLSGKEAAN
jgi:hypothetical protein